MSGWSQIFAVTRAEIRASAAPARVVTSAGLRAWGGADPRRAGEVTVKLARKGGCLPARAGTRVEGGAHCIRAWLSRSAETLHAALDRIDDRVEFVATLEAPLRLESDRPLFQAKARSGAQYLRAAAAAQSERRASRDELIARATALADALPGGLSDAPRRLVASEDGRVDISLLAPIAAKPVFALGLTAHGKRLPPNLRLSGSGPWAPHSFADVALETCGPRPQRKEISHAAQL